MSNATAIGAATAVLSHIIGEAIAPHVSPPDVSVGVPETLLGAQGDSGRVNVFLYATRPNPSIRNFDLPHRNSQGGFIDQPKLALDLHYLLTFYGDGDEMLPERLAGATLGELYRNPILSRTVIQSAIDDILLLDASSFVADADLAEQFETIRINPIDLTIEEMSNLWSNFQAAYSLSAAIEVSVVVVEPEVEIATGPPVMSRGVFVVPGLSPTIESIEPQLIDFSPGATVHIHGSDLAGDAMVVEFGSHRVDAPAAGPSRLRTSLPATITAGIHPVRVIRTLPMGEPARPRDVAQSNTAVVMVRPAVTGVAFAPAPDPTITVQLDPAVQPEQDIALLVTEVSPTPGQIPQSQQLETTVAAATTSVSFSPVTLPAGDYLVRVRIDGAESPLQLLADGTLTGPGVTVP